MVFFKFREHTGTIKNFKFNASNPAGLLNLIKYNPLVITKTEYSQFYCFIVVKVFLKEADTGYGMRDTGYGMRDKPRYFNNAIDLLNSISYHVSRISDRHPKT